MSKAKIIILTTVFVDVLGIGIIIPILPFYVQSFSTSAILMTSLFAVYSLCSFFSAPVIGRVSDKIGRRPMLIGSIFSTAVGWFIFAFAHNILFLFIGRIIDGVMAGNLPMAQSYLVDISKDDKDRASNLGLIGAIFGMGFIIGPFLGGVLGHISLRAPFIFVGALALINSISAYFLLPESNMHTHDEKISINPFIPIKNAFNAINLRLQYSAWFFFSLAIATYQVIFSLFLKDTLSFNTFQVGLVFGFVGILIGVNQGLLMKKVWLKKFEPHNLEKMMLIMFAVGFALFYFRNIYGLIIALILTTFGQSTLRGVMNSNILKEVDNNKKGEALGILSSIASLAMIIGPIVTGFIYAKNIYSPFFISAVMLLIAFFLIYKKYKHIKA